MDDLFEPPLLFEPPPQKNREKRPKKKWVVLAAVGVALTIWIANSISHRNVLRIEDYDGLGPVVVGYEKLGSGKVVIPRKVVAIGTEAFKGCEDLYSITIPDNVKIIGAGAFEGCTYLSEVTIKNGVTKIGDRAFYECYSLVDIEIPDSVTSIGDYAFFECDLAEIEIPDSVTEIGEAVFANCSLTSVKIPRSVTKIGDYAFDWCDKLTSVEIPDSVTEIGDYAFAACMSLTSIEIPDSVIKIGERAFTSCYSLNSVTIPARFWDQVEDGDIFFNPYDPYNLYIQFNFYVGSGNSGNFGSQRESGSVSATPQPTLPPRTSSDEEKTVLNWIVTEDAPDVDIVGYYADEWGFPVSYTIYVGSGTVKDFCIVSFDWMEEPVDGAMFEVSNVLMNIGDLTVGQGIVMEICLGETIPGTGFACRNQAGKTFVYTFAESGEDGSIYLSQDMIKQDY